MPLARQETQEPGTRSFVGREAVCYSGGGCAEWLSIRRAGYVAKEDVYKPWLTAADENA